jgi:transcriptional regulator with XRE-family HTH domain
MGHPHVAYQRQAKGQGVPTETQRDVFRKALRRAREARGLSKRGLARKVGVTQSAVWQWEEGKVAPRPEAAVALERVLGLQPGALAQSLGYLPAEGVSTVTVSVIEAIESDPRLGKRERELLATMYRELLRQRDDADGQA